MHQSCSDPALNSTSPDPIQHSIEYVMYQQREKKSSRLKLSNCAQDNTAKHLKQITVFTLWKLSPASATTHKSPKHQTPNIQMFLSFPEGQCERHTKDTYDDIRQFSVDTLLVRIWLWLVHSISLTELRATELEGASFSVTKGHDLK